LLPLRVRAPSKNEFYAAQTIVGVRIHTLASESVRRASEDVIDGDAIGIDGSWDHRRNGSLCIVAFVDLRTRLLLDCEIKMRPKQYVPGNVPEAEPSNHLEKLAVEALVARWRGDRRVRCYGHDDDGCTRKAITESGWETVEVLDHGHAKSIMRRRIEQWSRTHNRLFHNIMEKIERWFVTLTSTEVDPEVRVRKRLESDKHYMGDPTGCHHGPKSTEWWMRSHGGRPDDVEALQEFFHLTSTIVGKVHPGLHPNANE
jgi:hypothetical protein